MQIPVFDAKSLVTNFSLYLNSMQSDNVYNDLPKISTLRDFTRRRSVALQIKTCFF